MKKILYLSVFLFSAAMLNAQKADILLPSKMDRETMINHLGYSLSYNSGYVLPSWVAYKVTKSQINKDDKVKDKYEADPDVMTRSASKKDYKNSGYLMAQLVNYDDVRQIPDAAEETFYMSNIVPMKLAFYNHIWLKAEQLIRLWTADNDGLYVVTGPVLADGPFPTFGEDNVSIPRRYYKAVYDPKNQKAMGFIFTNGTTSGSLKSYSMSIDDLEKEIGIDLFPSLNDEKGKQIEATYNPDDWNFELVQ